MSIPLWLLLIIVCIAGAIGGLINAMLSDNGFLLPRKQEVDQQRILRPGFLGNMVIGMVAAAISWGLYGPLSTTPIFSVLPAVEGLTLSALVGIGGARWVTSEIDKKLLTVAASKAAAAPPAPQAAQQIVAASPAQALSIAQQL